MNKSALKSPLSSLDPPLSQAPSSEDLSTPSADEARQLTSAIDRLVGRGCSELDLLTDSAEARAETGHRRVNAAALAHSPAPLG